MPARHAASDPPAAVTSHGRWAAGLLVAAGLALAGGLVATGRPVDPLIEFGGWFMLLYGLLALARSTPKAGALHRHLQQSVIASGVGFYGLFTLSRFVQLETQDLLAGIHQWSLDQATVRAAVIEWLIGFSMESLHNSIDAALWPVTLVRDFGIGTAAVLGALLGLVYVGGGMLFPDLRRGLLRDEDD